jgi:hypothetical protein
MPVERGVNRRSSSLLNLYSVVKDHRPFGGLPSPGSLELLLISRSAIACRIGRGHRLARWPFAFFTRGLTWSKMVGLERFELSTPRLSSVCSDQLSYRPPCGERVVSCEGGMNLLKEEGERTVLFFTLTNPTSLDLPGSLSSLPLVSNSSTCVKCLIRKP